MCIRFFILQAHYRSTLDFSNEALNAADKGYKRLMVAVQNLGKLSPSSTTSAGVKKFLDEFPVAAYAAMDDDFNSPILIAHLFEAVKWINLLVEKREQINETDLASFRDLIKSLVTDILGLQEEEAGSGNEAIAGLMDLILEWRQQVKANKDFATSDRIRDELKKLGITIKDAKDGASWEM